MQTETKTANIYKGVQEETDYVYTIEYGLPSTEGPQEGYVGLTGNRSNEEQFEFDIVTEETLYTESVDVMGIGIIWGGNPQT